MGSKEGHKVKLPTEKAAAAHRLLIEWKKNEEGLTVASISKKLEEFCNDKLIEIPKDKTFSEMNIGDFIGQSTAIYRALKGKKFSGDRIGKAFYLYFLDKNPRVLKTYEKGEALILKEPFVRAAYDLMGYGDILNVPYARTLVGKYKLYRPFHENPTGQISVCSFEIGSRKSPYDCKFENRFEERGKTISHKSRGKVMHQHDQRGRMTAITTGSERISSHFIFHFDYIGEEDGVPAYMAGNLISSWGLRDSSSWPFYVERLQKDEKFTPHLIDFQEVSKLPEFAQDRLQRGFIDWKAPGRRLGAPG